jgi:aromatic-L-amino-acid/L-tryptophan decarboxylase
VSGGSAANLTAIACAREALIGPMSPRVVMYTGDQTHSSVARAARHLGFRPDQVRVLPTDDDFRLRPQDVTAAIDADLAADRLPFLVSANVGTTNTGAIDPLPEILDIARRHELWVHADAAYGGFFRLVPEGAARMPGIERCDSITLDPHKGLFLPYGTGCLLVLDPESLRRAHEGGAAYLQDVGVGRGLPNFTDLSPELSRDFRGLRLWLPIQLHGMGAFREQIQEKLDLARLAHHELKDDPFFRMLDEPQLSIVAFTAKPPAGDPDAFGAELLRRVNGRRRVFLSSSTIGGRYVLRICVLSFRTHADRVRDAVAGLKEEARLLAGV